MAKLLIDTPRKLEKIKPRRNSTGNASSPIFNEASPIPNYLRRPIGSCHDLCKHGSRRDLPPESEQHRNRNVKPTKTNIRGKRASVAKNSVPIRSSIKQPKPKPPVRKQLNKRLEMSRDDAGKGIRISKESKKRSSSGKIPSEEIELSKSSTNMASKSAESLEIVERTISGDIPEKFIHVTQQNLNLDHKNMDHQGNLSTPSYSSPNQKQKVDPATKSWSRAVRITRVVMKENGSSPRKQKMKMEKSLGIGNGEPSSKGSSLRTRVVHDESMNATKLTRISRCKVKALVDGFETLVNIQDLKTSRAYRHRKYTCGMVNSVT